MTPDSEKPRWPDIRCLVGGGAIVFGIGVVVAMLPQMGTDNWRPVDLLSSGLASLVVFFMAGALGLVVGDVAGKGVGASLIMASVKSVLPLLTVGRMVEDTLFALNEKLCDELDRRQFVALAFARYEPARGELSVANAGLPDPYLLRQGALAEPVCVEGPRVPLGLMRDQVYLSTRVTLSPGDAFLMFSDGLPEATELEGDWTALLLVGHADLLGHPGL